MKQAAVADFAAVLSAASIAYAYDLRATMPYGMALRSRRSVILDDAPYRK